MTTHENVRGRRLRAQSVLAAALITIGFFAAQTATGQDAGVSVSMKRSDQRVVYGESVAVRGRVNPSEEGRAVELQYARRGGSFRTVKRATTSDTGRYRLKTRPVRSGRLRVVAEETPPSTERKVAVKARFAGIKRQRVKQGRRAAVSGRLRPGFAGRIVKIQVRKNGSWRTVDRTKTRKKGRFTASWKVTRGAGSYRTRVVFGGDRRNARRVKRSRMLVFRPGGASYYGPGLYGNRTACGQTLTPGTIGVANRWLPCGTKVTFLYRGRTVTVPVIDRGPFHGSRIWDLTYATKRKLGFGSTGTVWATR